MSRGGGRGPGRTSEGLTRRSFVPRNPTRHALALGVLGLVLSAVGAIVAITTMGLGQAWYPIAVALTAVPCAWLGGALLGMRQAERSQATDPE